MKILITGSSGMLGRALCQELSNRYKVVGMDVVRLEASGLKLEGFLGCDITDREKTAVAVASIKPDIIVHTAAYTDVDGCQQNPEKANTVNALGTETVALACQRCNAFLYYISTDFVFDGEKETPYLESDRPGPINIYGKSKLEGEKYVQSTLKDYIIVRSSWLFGKGGRNFVENICNKAQTEKEIKVVRDQVGSPTYVNDLAKAINRLISLANKENGIYYITNSGHCSWYEFALAIKEVAKLKINIVAVLSEEYHSPTLRPKMSVLDNRRYQQCTGESLRNWQEALREYLQDTFLVDSQA